MEFHRIAIGLHFGRLATLPGTPGMCVDRKRLRAFGQREPYRQRVNGKAPLVAVHIPDQAVKRFRMGDDPIDLIMDLIEILIRRQLDIASANTKHHATSGRDDFIAFSDSVTLDTQHLQKRPRLMTVGGNEGKGNLPIDAVDDLVIFCPDEDLFPDIQNALFRELDVYLIFMDSLLRPQRRCQEKRDRTQQSGQQPLHHGHAQSDTWGRARSPDFATSK